MSESVFAAILLSLAVASSPAQLPDPTRRVALSATVAPQADQAFRLQSTVIRGEERVAMVNGQRVREGDLVDDARVIRIDHGAIEIVRHGNRSAVTLFTEIGMRPAQHPQDRP